MILYLLQGAALSISAAVMPGPLQTYLLSQALKSGWKRTLPAVLAPLVTDGLIIALVLFVLTRTPQWFLNILRFAGGLFVLYLAVTMFLTLKRADIALKPSKNTARQTFFNAVIMNFLNPNPYIFWSVVSGPIVLTGWRQSPAQGMAFLLGFYGTFVCCLALLIFLFATAGKIHPKVNRILRLLAAGALSVFGLYQIVMGIWALL